MVFNKSLGLHDVHGYFLQIKPESNVKYLSRAL